jgi:hypothetical protein
MNDCKCKNCTCEKPVTVFIVQSKCPACDSDKVEGRFEVTMEGETIIQHQWCNNCFSNWDRIYTPQKVSNLKTDFELI